MQTIKTKKKAFELAQDGKLFFIDNGRYVAANIGLVISKFGELVFYARKNR